MEKISNVGWFWDIDGPILVEEAIDKINEIVDEINKLTEAMSKLTKKLNDLTGKVDLVATKF